VRDVPDRQQPKLAETSEIRLCSVKHRVIPNGRILLTCPPAGPGLIQQALTSSKCIGQPGLPHRAASVDKNGANTEQDELCLYEPFIPLYTVANDRAEAAQGASDAPRTPGSQRRPAHPPHRGGSGARALRIHPSPLWLDGHRLQRVDVVDGPAAGRHRLDVRFSPRPVRGKGEQVRGAGGAHEDELRRALDGFVRTSCVGPDQQILRTHHSLGKNTIV
jgi:hypothetical protein